MATLKGSNTTIFIFTALQNGGQLLKESIFSLGGLGDKGIFNTLLKKKNTLQCLTLQYLIRTPQQRDCNGSKGSNLLFFYGVSRESNLRVIILNG